MNEKLRTETLKTYIVKKAVANSQSINFKIFYPQFPRVGQLASFEKDAVGHEIAEHLRRICVRLALNNPAHPPKNKAGSPK